MRIQKPYFYMLMSLILLVSRAAWATDASLSERKAQKPPVYTTESLRSPVSRDPAWARQPTVEDLRRQAPFAKDRSSFGPVQIVKPTDGELKKAPAFKGSSL